MVWLTITSLGMIAVMCSLQRQVRDVFYLIFAIGLIAVSSIRYKTGYDFDTYQHIFDAIQSGDYPIGIEPGWVVSNWMITLVTRSSFLVFFLSSVLVYGLIAWVIRKESKYAAIGLFAFVLQIPFYWESLSIIRQYIAIAIGFAAACQYLNGKRVLFYLLTLVATLFHYPGIVTICVPLLMSWKSRWSFLCIAIIGSFSLNFAISNHIESIDLLEKYHAYYNGVIDARGVTASGLVLYARMLVASMMILQIEKAAVLDQRRKNLVANCLILAYAIFLFSLSLPHCVEYLIIFLFMSCWLWPISSIVPQESRGR